MVALGGGANRWPVVSGQGSEGQGKHKLYGVAADVVRRSVEDTGMSRELIGAPIMSWRRGTNQIWPSTLTTAAARRSTW